MEICIDDNRVGPHRYMAANGDSFSSAKRSPGHKEIGPDLQASTFLPGTQNYRMIWSQGIRTHRRTQAQAGTKAHPAVAVFLDDRHSVKAPVTSPGNAVAGKKQPHAGNRQPAPELVPNLPGSVKCSTVQGSICFFRDHTLVLPSYLLNTFYNGKGN